MEPTKLLIQPGAGIAPLIAGIDAATEIIQIIIFRFDRGDVEMALKRAAKRGVFVHALVAYTSSGQGGENMLRKLEMRLLADGISVARTAVDLVRYHDKLMIVDKRLLFMLGFNYTYLDTERSRSFGIVTELPEWVEEAEKLFVADSTGQAYTAGCDTFLVSPGNSRTEMLAFLNGARHQLLIYDGKLTDPEMLALLASKAKDGVEIRVIGAVSRNAPGVTVAAPSMRLHAQAIVRDSAHLFLGSQSLRALELDARREVGIIVNDDAITMQVKQTFEADWEKIVNSRQKLNAQDEPHTTSSKAAPDAKPLSAEESAQIIELAVKDAIMDAVKSTIQQTPDMLPLKTMVKEAAKEALAELAM